MKTAAEIREFIAKVQVQQVADCGPGMPGGVFLPNVNLAEIGEILFLAQLSFAQANSKPSNPDPCDIHAPSS